MTGDAPAGETEAAPATPSLWKLWLSDHRLGVGLIALLSATAYAAVGLVKLATFRASVFDLVIFDQTVRNYAHFRPPYAPAVGAIHGRGLDYLQLADHFSPAYALLAPFYWVHDGPESLVVAQALLFAAAIPFVWLFTRRVLGTGPAYLVAVAYALSWPVAQAIAFDVHEVMFVPLLTSIMIERYHAGRSLPAFAAMGGLLLVKEDMGLMVIGFALYLFVTGDRFRGVCCAAIGVGGVLLARGALIPMLGGSADDFWAYGHLGPDVPGALLTLLRDPVAAILLPFSDEAKVDTLFLMAWPTLLLCLLSPLSLVALPHVLERMLADRALWWQADFQYNAFTVVILLCAGVDGLARLLRRLRRPDDRPLRLAWAFGACVVAVTLVPRFALDQLYHPDFYRGDQVKVAAAREAVAKVPAGVVVEAANSVGPALSARTTVLLWTGQPHGAPWVVADTARWEFPFGSAEEQAAQVGRLEAEGYRRVFERDGYVVLRSSGRG
ncbi:DUF2079 domain-containing protein [Nonomuraea sp. 3-1Str]|uniref:DUF2079 domain-containing protein n=1 Tax=Nonomuraea sp. 3-1Str TaxID=2929801 RepID=UPI00285DC216|nr:DUF2079 domain-containing protein [Nonomuraea sp. 3-1Str]MDR8414955.1 DUF2079 domain-containing protein [Nonomuraea sp. 3-1Str]